MNKIHFICYNGRKKQVLDAIEIKGQVVTIDANHTLDKIAAQNQNVIRKWCLSILKLLEINGKKMSMPRKRFNISMNPVKYLEKILSL